MINEIASKGIYFIGALSTGNLANEAIKGSAAQVVVKATELVVRQPELFLGYAITEWAALFSIVGVVGMVTHIAFQIWFKMRYERDT